MIRSPEVVAYSDSRSQPVVRSSGDALARFFLSYARIDDEGARSVQKFYLDLCSRFRELTTLEASEIGFMDTSDMRSGVLWKKRLAAELANCDVFVPLYSPSYFASDYCGREWNVFSSRLVPGPAGGAAASGPVAAQLLQAAIVPIVWQPATSFALHEAAKDFQYRNLGGSAYIQYGLVEMVRNRAKARQRYSRFLSDLVQEIQTASAVKSPWIPVPPDLDDVRSAFLKTPDVSDPISTSGPDTVALLPAAAGGPGPGEYRQQVRLVVAAPRRGEAVVAGAQPGPYHGDRPFDWAPFAPLEPEPLADDAAEVVRRERMRPLPEALDESLMARLAVAQRDNDLVVFLVDPRVSAIEEYAKLLRAYDDHQDEHPNAGSMVIWNLADRENLDRREILRRSLTDAWPSRTRKGAVDRTFVVLGAGGREDFQTHLTQLLILLLKIMLGRDVGSTWDSGGVSVIPRPSLGGKVTL